jgi:hypothetical protein
MNLSLKEFKAFPGPDGKPVVKGIAVGYCVDDPNYNWKNDKADRQLGSKTGQQHAHAHYSDPKVEGWICVRTISDLGRDDRVSGTLMHELAHLVARTGHDDKWRRAMRRLGQFVAPAWQKKPRVAHG